MYAFVDLAVLERHPPRSEHRGGRRRRGEGGSLDLGGPTAAAYGGRPRTHGSPEESSGFRERQQFGRERK
uniref:Uncharacterized protein n=1 Tax=Leersia perrieri TaxID=77586 RepID=A0A0D9VR80_9ORYZ